MNREPFSLSGTMGQEQMETPSGVPRAAWLGHLKLCDLTNVKSASLHFSYWSLVAFAEI